VGAALSPADQALAVDDRGQRQHAATSLWNDDAARRG
jgi:hypothetical protein